MRLRRAIIIAPVIATAAPVSLVIACSLFHFSYGVLSHKKRQKSSSFLDYFGIRKSPRGQKVISK
jgi:hypothetical protein